MSAFCPKCGHNIEADRPVEIDGWLISPTTAQFRGESFKLTSTEAIMLHSIASAGGEPVRASVLAERVDSNADTNVVQVMIHRIRKAIPGVPIETMRDAGYRWSQAQGVAA